MTRARAAEPPDARHPSLSGLSKAVVEKLGKLGIARKFDLVLHLPLRYYDETALCPITDVMPGEELLVQGKVTDCDIKFRPNASWCAASLTTAVKR